MTLKSDKSIKSICIAAIKRRISSPLDFRSTILIENETLGRNDLQFDSFEPGEVPIVVVFESSSRWTLITTRRVLTKADGKTLELRAKELESWNWGSFKVPEGVLSIGSVKGKRNEEIPILIENGRASLMPIYGVMTLAKISKEDTLA